MPRPRLHRHVRSSFDYDYFKPCATCLQDIDEVVLKMEEIRHCMKGKQTAVFLDYDGTLTPIVAHPEEAVLYEDMRSTILELADVNIERDNFHGEWNYKICP